MAIPILRCRSVSDWLTIRTELRAEADRQHRLGNRDEAFALRRLAELIGTTTARGGTSLHLCPADCRRADASYDRLVGVTSSDFDPTAAVREAEQIIRSHHA